MSEQTYTHDQMVEISDDAKREVLDAVERRLKSDKVMLAGAFNVISLEASLADINIIRAENGLTATNKE